MIDERMEEQASLHVLGALTAAEAMEFKKVLQTNSALQAYVARLSVATGALAGAIPLNEPPPQLRAKILAQIGEPQKMLALPERKPGFFNWWPWVAAACLVVLSLALATHSGWLKQQLTVALLRNHELDNVVATLQSETNTLQQTVTTLLASQNDWQQMVGTLQSATNNLQQTVAALQATNRLATMKIAMLNSLLADAPTAVAVSLWDESKQEGVFVVQHLKSLPADRDYQLWVLENGTTPVDAGVFRVDAEGSVRVEFKTKQPIKIAGKFAVTEEVRGGVLSPTIKNMVLAGG